MKNKTVKFNCGNAILNVYNYNNGRLAIFVNLENSDEPFGDLTINLMCEPINSYCDAFIDPILNDSTFNLVPNLKKLGIIKESYGMVNYNFGVYEHVKFNLEKLKEYDKKGVNEFLKFKSDDVDYNIKI